MRKSWTGTIYFLYSTETRNFTIRGPGLGSGLKFSGRGIPGLDYAEVSRGPNKFGTRSLGLKISQDAVPVLCRPLR